MKNQIIKKKWKLNKKIKSEKSNKKNKMKNQIKSENKSWGKIECKFVDMEYNNKQHGLPTQSNLPFSSENCNPQSSK